MDSSSTILLCEITLSESCIFILHLFNCQVALRRLCLLRHRSGQVRLGSWVYFPSASGRLLPRLLPPSGGLGSSPGAWGAPKKRNADGTVGIFVKCRTRVGYGTAPGPTIKKGLVPHLPVGWGSQQILQYLNTVALAGILVIRSRVRPSILDTTGE